MSGIRRDGDRSPKFVSSSNNENRKKFINRWNALDQSYKINHGYYQTLSQYILAYRGRFLSDGREKNKRIKRYMKQINNKGRIASRTLQSGLMAGITSPARPWFKLGTPDPDLAKSRSVKKYLSAVETIMREVFAQSNIYNSFHQLYGELGNFATAPMGIFQDFDNVIHSQAYTIGSYRIATDEKGIVNTFYREYMLSVDQMIKKWGEKGVSDSVQKLFRDGKTETMRKILHVIETNDNRDQMSVAARNKPIRSVYIELDDEASDIIRSGYNSYPIMCPRWEVLPEEDYGVNCPGMDAIGDVKALQLGEQQSASAIEFQVKPPLQAPASFSEYKGTGGLFPGEIIIGDDVNRQGMRPIHDAGSFDLQWHEQKLKEIENRIDKAFYVDLFQLISNDQRSNITAREISERHEEKLLMLGPVLERLHNELLDPVIDRTYQIMDEVGILPKPPQELENNELTVNYISILAQAQRLVVVNDLNTFTGFVAGQEEMNPGSRYKINSNKMIDAVANAMSIDPDLVNDDDEVEARKEQDVQQQQAVQAAEMAPGLAQAADTVDPSGDISQRLTGG